MVDAGHGIDVSALDKLRDVGHGRESGQRTALMNALADQIKFESGPESGTIVHLMKQLEFDGRSPRRGARL